MERRRSLTIALLAVVCPLASAQYTAYSRHTGAGAGGALIATGDSRNVTEPVFPPVCSTVAATKFIVSTNAVNIDPWNATCGSTGGTFGILGCTGGTDYQPSLFSGSYSASEALDNTAVQNALNACAPGQAVEIIPAVSGRRGIVLAPWTLPSGVSLILDAGIHVFASRNLSDYAGTNCGVVTAGTSSCNHWITAASTTGSGIYGYGTLDGRGWDSYIGTPTQSFYANRIQAYCNARGLPCTQHGAPAATPNGAGTNSFGPNMFNLVGANSFTIYKTTLKDSGNFGINWKGSTGFTAWGAKIIAPFEVSNTDGFDPLNATNGTFTRGFISNGDNQVAVKSDATLTSNITVSRTQTGAGIALAIGSATQFGITNVLFDTIQQNGNLNNDQSGGIQIGSSGANGGAVNQVTYQNFCMVNENKSIRIFSNFNGDSGANTPIYHDILLRQIAVLPSTAPYTTGNSGTFTFQGLSGNPILGQIDGLSIQGINQGIQSQSGVADDRYMTAFIGSGPIDASVPFQFAAGTSVTTAGSGASNTPYCTVSSWQPLIGELNLKTAVSNNNQSYNGAPPYTLQAVLEPATAISTKESPAPTASIQFKDNGSTIATVALSGDGTYAFYVVASASSGTHVYTANYVGDLNYSAYSFGSVTVVVP